jgi:hypothetical protein
MARLLSVFGRGWLLTILQGRWFRWEEVAEAGIVVFLRGQAGCVEIHARARLIRGHHLGSGQCLYLPLP